MRLFTYVMALYSGVFSALFVSEGSTLFAVASIVLTLYWSVSYLTTDLPE